MTNAAFSIILPPLIPPSALPMLKSLLPLCPILACHCLNAATVNAGHLETSYQDLSHPYVSSIESTASITVDLSNLTGLTPGADIKITFSTADPLFWVGMWRADAGQVTLNYDATFTLTVGSHAVSSSPAWSPFGPVEFDGLFIPVAGWEMGPVPASFSLAVPWGTDLSNVTIALTDRISITGPNAGIENSGLSLNSLTLTTTSIPEPSAAILTLLSAAALLRRRRS
jgi:hypothetical protein